MRDANGFVLCCHGRPMYCLECGDEYEAEIAQQQVKSGEAEPAASNGEAVVRKELIDARNNLMKAIVKYRGGYPTVMDDCDEAVAALDIAIGKAFTIPSASNGEAERLATLRARAERLARDLGWAPDDGAIPLLERELLAAYRAGQEAERQRCAAIAKKEAQCWPPYSGGTARLALHKIAGAIEHGAEP